MTGNSTAGDHRTLYMEGALYIIHGLKSVPISRAAIFIPSKCSCRWFVIDRIILLACLLGAEYQLIYRWCSRLISFGRGWYLYLFTIQKKWSHISQIIVIVCSTRRIKMAAYWGGTVFFSKCAFHSVQFSAADISIVFTSGCLCKTP